MNVANEGKGEGVKRSRKEKGKEERGEGRSETKQ